MISGMTGHELPNHAPLFCVNATDLVTQSIKAANEMKSLLDRLVSEISPASATFDNVILPFVYQENEFKAVAQFVALFQAVAVTPEIREAASKAINIINKADLSIYVRTDLFRLVCAVRDSPAELDSESRLFLDRIHAYFVDVGSDLTGPQREAFHSIEERLLELRVAFMENLGKHPGDIWKTVDELEGLPENIMEGLERDPQTEKRKICLKKPHVTAVLTFCKNQGTRREVFLHSQNIFPENVPIFRETVLLRDEAARMLGFDNFASRRLAKQMAKTSDNVITMLDDLKAKLQPKATAELSHLAKLEGNETEPIIRLWDFDYYNNLMLKQEHSINHEQIAEYFSAERVIRKMLDLFQRIFGLYIRELSHEEMQQLSATKNAQDLIWAPGIGMFAVWNETSCNRAFLGYLYTDIYPRAGKYTHAANFNICPGYLKEAGTRRTVVTALVCNVSPPTESRPALLRHQEVITLFHELGHSMHDLLSKTRYARFHGHRTLPDFVEAPSQLLEHFCWDSHFLRELSLHYSYLSDQSGLASSFSTATRVSQQLDLEVVERLSAAKNVNSALSALRQVAFSSFDMCVHGPTSSKMIQDLDISSAYNRIRQEVGLLAGLPAYKDGHGYVVTSHYMWGQEANYYSYLYTRIFAADMFQALFKGDIMSGEAGHRFRSIILERGGAHDEMKSMVELLGREPNIAAYAKDIGIS